MFAIGTVNMIVKNLLALIPTGSVVLTFINGIRNLGSFIGNNAAPLVLGGLLGRAHQCIEGQRALRIAQDAAATTRMDADDDLFYATEMISFLKEDWMDTQDENLFLLDEIADVNFNEAALIQTNEALLDQLLEEKHNVEKRGKDCDSAEEENKHLKKKLEELQESLIQKEKEIENLNEHLAGKEKECQENREKVEELQKQAEDNDFYCGYLEKKVKAHEVERKRLNQAAAELEERLRVSQREPVSVLTRNRDLEKNHGHETQKNRGLPKVHIMEARVQSLPKENKNEKHTNKALVEEAKAKGNMLYKLGRLEEACECFLKVMDLVDGQADYRLRLGLCLLLLGRHSEALVQLEELDGQHDLVAAAKALQRMQCYGCPYYILGIAEKADLKEIDWAYRKRALQFDPGRCQGSQEQQRRKEIMQKVNYANDLLHDSEERGEYDAVREFIKELAAEVFQDPSETTRTKRKKRGRTTKRMNTKGN
ncbi:polyamine-modulated factor 1-binding protein 1-like [Macrobrachium nipponense]|uniref:polyamine-modulated factor 1-binding protein 1-like n=1 Tax=Macrobrachium nipponense TaxID=159736 RepID=UPI0030C82DCC